MIPMRHFSHAGDYWTVEVRGAVKTYVPPGWTVLYFHAGKKRRWEPFLAELVPTLTVEELRGLVDHAREIPKPPTA